MATKQKDDEDKQSAPIEMDEAGHLEALEQLHRFVVRLEGAAVSARLLGGVEAADALDLAGDQVERLLTSLANSLDEPRKGKAQ